MATPSVLTVPSMYGDGILYSGPSAYGSELASQPVDLQVDFQAAPAGGVIVDSNTFTTSGGGLEGIRSNDPVFTLPAGTAFEIEIRGSTTSNGITLGNLSGAGNEYGSGFGVHRFVSLNNRLWIRQNSAGTTTITYLSIRQVTQGSDFEFTRATTGTRINEEGYIEDVPYNIISYSEDYTNSSWTKTGSTTVSLNDTNAPNNTLTASTISGLTGSGGNDLFSLTGLNPANQTFTFSVYLKGQGTLRMQISNNVDQGVQQIVTLTSKWERYTLTGTFNSTSGNLSATLDDSGATATTYKVWGAQIVKGDEPKNYLPTTDRLNLPRLNYPVYGGCPSLLVEPQRTNTVKYSQDFSQYSTGGGLTLTTGFLAPDGTNSATKITATIGTSSLYRTGESSTTASRTIWARTVSGTGTAGLLSYFANTDNLFTITEKWQRFEVNSAVATGGGNFYAIDFRDTSQTLSEIIIWGGQSEEATYATSYIPTSGSTVTRNEDKAENAGLGTTDTFNDDEGVLYAELRFDQIVSGNYIGIDDGTTSNRIIIGAEGSNIRVYSPGFTFGINNLPMFDVNKIAFSWQTNLRKLFINGIKLGEDTSAYTGPTGLNQLAFDSGSASQIFDGEAKAVAVYKTALTDTELANLTSYNNHDLFIPYRSRMQMIGADQELQCTEHDITRFL